MLYNQGDHGWEEFTCAITNPTASGYNGLLLFNWSRRSITTDHHVNMNTRPSFYRGITISYFKLNRGQMEKSEGEEEEKESEQGVE